MDINLALVVLSLGLALIGMNYDKSMFTFISGFLFLYIGLTADHPIFIVSMIGLAIFQFFNTFFEYRRPGGF